MESHILIPFFAGCLKLSPGPQTVARGARGWAGLSCLSGLFRLFD